MGFLDWLRGNPRDTQEERAEALRGDEGVTSSSQTAEDVETEMAMRRDQEAGRHSGI